MREIAQNVVYGPAAAALLTLAVFAMFRALRQREQISLRRFLSSSFLRRRRLLRRCTLRLANGRRRHLFHFEDAHSPRGELEVEFLGGAERVDSVCCRWWGESPRQPAQWTAERREFLAGVLASAAPRAKLQPVLEDIEACLGGPGAKDEAGLPRRRTGLFFVRAGRVGRALVVMVEAVNHSTSWQG